MTRRVDETARIPGGRQRRAPSRPWLAGRFAVIPLILATVPLSGTDYDLETDADAAPHLRLKESSPAEDETVSESPEAVTLIFTQAPQMAGTSVRLLPRGGEPLELEDAVASEDDPATVVLTLAGSLDDGEYVVMWRAMAQDGHTIRGDFAFTVEADPPNFDPNPFPPPAPPGVPAGTSGGS